MILQLSTDAGAFASFEIYLRDYKTLLELKTQKGHFRTLSSDRFIHYNWPQIPKRHMFPLGPDIETYLFRDLASDIPIPGAETFMCWVTDLLTVLLS